MKRFYKWLGISLLAFTVLLYGVHFITYRDYDDKHIIYSVNDEGVIFGPIKLYRDAAYGPLETQPILDSTTVSGFGFMSLFIHDKDSLKEGQRVRVWYEETNEIQKIIVYGPSFLPKPFIRWPW
ncbi:MULTISPECIES: hypothetical protein [Bacillus]|uniref:hypothetical protein n=1 Tax=Bacillus TaxID=1386 RepID=UPI000BB8BFB9|nr:MULTISPECIES: hypothetical protein [Bacillus]